MNAQAIEWYFQHLDQQGMALLAENYAWVDERLEDVCLQGQAEEQAEEEEQEGDDLWDEAVIPMEEDNEDAEDDEDEDEGAAVVPMDISDDDDSSDDEYQLAPIQLFPAMDEDEDDDLIPNMALLQLPGPPALRRSNTIVYQDDNVTVYNGNPNGSRFFDHDPDADDE